jgi:glycerol-3-phosphate dehydrogenase (NAD(P)+)
MPNFALQQAPVAVLGAGSWGTALALSLSYSGHAVRLWGHDTERMASLVKQRCNTTYLPQYPFPSCLMPTADLQQALQGVSAICIVVPSFAFTEVLQKIQPLIADDLPIIWGTKGLGQADALLSDEVRHHLGERPMATVCGPSFAKEVAARCPTAVTATANSAEFAKAVADLFSSPSFRVYENTDLIGAQICGVVKNVLAIAAGISDGMNLGHNALSALITRGLAEMARLCVAMGGESETVAGLCGLGDLVLTCTGDLSRIRRFGKALGLGASPEQAARQIGQAVEGMHNVEQVHALMQQYQVRMPISSVVYQIIHLGLDPKDALTQLMEGKPG